MDYAVLLSKEHPHIPLAELDGAFAAEGIDHEVVDRKDALVFLDADEIEPVADRLAMAFEVSEPLFKFPPENYQKLAMKDVAAEEPFAVRVERLDDTRSPEELERNIGRIINKQSDTHVDLDDPAEVFRVYLYDGAAYLCRLIDTIDRSAFEQRQNQYRPFSAPVTIHPRLARALVNIAEAPRDGTVCDPFCGTGGILLEAGLIGCDVYGLDIQDEMVDGAQENLDAFGVDGTVEQGDVADIADVFDMTFDAVVTDLPYGKASKSENDPVETFLDVAPEMCDGKTVFVSDRDDVDGMDPEFEIFVHRSLSRYVYVID